MEFLLQFTLFFCLLFQLHSQAFGSPYLLSNSSFSSSKLLCSYQQSHVLLQFKNAFAIDPSASSSYYEPPYPKTETWKEEIDCCEWDGVSCEIETGNVIALDLSNSMLFGTFSSSNSLFSLSHIQMLDLSNNDFNGSNIPSQFDHLLNLTHLNLNSSHFTGQVPSEISHLSNMISLDLSHNDDLSIKTIVFQKIVHNLTKMRELALNYVDMSMGSPMSFREFFSSLSSLKLSFCNLPREFLEYVSLSSNFVSLDLSGNFNLRLDTNSFVKLVQNLTNLKELDLGYVDLSSVAPSSYMNLSSILTTLRLKGCNLKGKFPNIFHLSKLTSLDLSENFYFIMDGMLFDNLTYLNEINLDSVNMSLVPPNYFMNLSSSLASLRLFNCGLRGEFPGELLQWPKLQLLHLGNNEDLSGFLPMSNMSKALLDLDLSYCNFIGSDLSLFGNLTKLRVLSLSNNNFKSEIPFSFENLQNLFQLDLSNCNLNGLIPSSLGNLRKLKLLNLDSNDLSGRIPSSFTNLTQLYILALRDNRLSGPLPTRFLNFSFLIELDLHGNQLTGSLPSQISCLSLIEYVYLSNNLFNGTIPSSLFTLPKLYFLSLKNNQFHGHIGQFHTKSTSIDLSNNKLDGPIPSSIFEQSTSLAYIDLSNNKLDGPIPTSNFEQSSSLIYIDLRNNNLDGPIPTSIFELEELQVLILSSNDKLNGKLPSLVCTARSLQILDLSNNSLTGFIPQCLQNLSYLSVLHFGMNNFHGHLPVVFPKNLRYLNFNGNQLQGGVPPSIADCEYLEILDLGNNAIDDTFPIFLASLPNLQILILRSNKFYGSLFVAKHSFSMLRILDLSNNMFSGTLPIDYFSKLQAMMNFSQYSKYMGEQNNYDYSVSLTFKGFEIQLIKIFTPLTTIDLSRNNFRGLIPDSIGKLKALKLLNLSHNQLTGNIQPSLGNLTSLESLDLSSNLLIGKIPIQLLDLTFLQVFNVSYNQLEGPIIQGEQFNTFGNDSYEGNLALCGFPVSKGCGDEDKENVEKSKPQEKGDSEYMNGFGWHAIVTGYGTGLVVGISIFYVLLTLKTPLWLFMKVEGEWHEKAKRLGKKLCQHYRRRN